MELNSYTQQSNHGIMEYINDHHGHEEEEEDVNGSLSSSSDDEEEEKDDGSLCSASEEEFMEDAASSSSSSSSSSFGSSSSSSSSNGPLFEMSALISELPFKRGLSKHFEGKSQSFTSLSNVKRLEDLIKPERPFKKKLKSSKSYGWGLDRSLLSTKTSSKAITKKSSTRGGSFSTIKNMKRRRSFSRNWPSFPPQGFGVSRLETIG